MVCNTFADGKEQYLKLIIFSWQWLAPNLITLIALFASFACSLQYLPFDGTLSKEFPAYTYYFGVFCIFVYQTLDAVDGKQSRRTKTSSPLGQLFDHGCDAINNSFINFFFCQAMQYGCNIDYFMMTFCSSVRNYNL